MKTIEQLHEWSGDELARLADMRSRVEQDMWQVRLRQLAREFPHEQHVAFHGAIDAPEVCQG
jgi:hypothetical protein